MKQLTVFGNVRKQKLEIISGMKLQPAESVKPASEIIVPATMIIHVILKSKKDLQYFFTE